MIIVVIIIVPVEFIRYVERKYVDKNCKKKGEVGLQATGSLRVGHD